jgi:hypothetical protein
VADTPLTRQGVFHDLIVEAIEEIALTSAIRQGADTELVSRKQGFDILKGQT